MLFNLTQDIVANMSGFISNHNTVWEYPRPYMPTHVNVLGMAMDQELPKIPKDVEEFMEGSQHGVIFFALGIR